MRISGRAAELGEQHRRAAPSCPPLSEHAACGYDSAGPTAADFSAGNADFLRRR